MWFLYNIHQGIPAPSLLSRHHLSGKYIANPLLYNIHVHM